MRAKEFLSDIHDNIQRIKALEDRRTDYYNMGMSCGIPEIRRDSSSNGSRVESVVERLVDDLSASLDRETKDLLIQHQAAERIIRALPNAKWRDVLEYRYLNGWSWSTVARAMHYNKRWIHRLHSEALEAFEREMNSEGK